MSLFETGIALSVVVIGVLLFAFVAVFAWRLSRRLWAAMTHATLTIAVLVAQLLNAALAPDPRNGRVSRQRILFWVVVNGIVLALSAFALPPLAQVLTASSLVLSYGLQVLARSVLLAEQARIIQGTLAKHQARLCGYEGAFPVSLLGFNALALVVSLGLLLAGLEAIFGEHVVLTHGTSNLLDWLLLLLTQVTYTRDVPIWFGLPPTLALAPGWGQVLGMAINALLGILLLSTLRGHWCQRSEIRHLVEGLQSDHADIEFLQRRVARFPSRIKTQIIDLALHHHEPVVRRRALGVLKYTRIISFPQVRLYSLHEEPVDAIKRQGLQAILGLFDDAAVCLSKHRRHKIRQALRYQLSSQRRRHSDEVVALLETIAAHPALSSNTGQPMAATTVERKKRHRLKKGNTTAQAVRTSAKHHLSTAQKPTSTSRRTHP